MKEYPECFPENFTTNILPNDAKEENKSVYRVIKYGIMNKDSFISTYEEMKKGLIPYKKNIDKNNPGLYSTSCNIDYSEAKYILDLIMRHKPEAYIAKGETEKTCGPSQKTSDREKERNDTHVDWWIYKEANPQLYFEKCEKGKNDE